MELRHDFVRKEFLESESYELLMFVSTLIQQTNQYGREQ